MKNTVESKPIIQIDIEQWLPKPDQIITLDIKPWLYRELILRESDFRSQIESYDWSIHRDKYTIITCSNQAIIPQWAYLILANHLEQVQSPAFPSSPMVHEMMLLHIISTIDLEPYRAKRLLIKGCGNQNLTLQPYIALTQRLTPIVRALSYGESCSMVPLFKN